MSQDRKAFGFRGGDLKREKLHEGIDRIVLYHGELSWTGKHEMYRYGYGKIARRDTLALLVIKLYAAQNGLSLHKA